MIFDELKVVNQKTLVVTIPRILESIQVIGDAKVSGRMFHATGSEHLNSDDYFKSQALIKRSIRIKLEK